MTENLQNTAERFRSRMDPKMIASDFTKDPRNATQEMVQTKPKTPAVKPVAPKKPKVNKVGNVETAFFTNQSSGQQNSLRKKDSISDVAGKLFNFMTYAEDERKIHFELYRNFEQEHRDEDKKRHNELIEALKKQKEQKPKPEEKKKEEEKKPEEKKKEEPVKEPGKAPAKEPVKEPTKTPQKTAEPVKPTEPVKAPEVKPTPSAKPVESLAPSAPTVTVPKPFISSGVSTATKVVGTTVVAGLLMPSITYANAIDDASKTVGVDRALMYAIAKQESGFNPNAKAGTSSAKGLYQFVSGTWNDMVKKYGKNYPILKEKGPEDANASAIAGALFIKENSAVLSKAKIPVDATSIYAAHFLGAGGAKTLFTADPNKKAADIMPDAAAANDFIFYEKTDKKVDKSKPRTVKQVIDVLFEKVGQYQEKYAQALQQKDLGTQLALGSIQNQELKKQGTSGTTVAIDNTQTNMFMNGNQGTPPVFSSPRRPDLPIQQQG